MAITLYLIHKLIGAINVAEGAILPEKDDYYQGAQDEFAGFDPEIQFMVYGHRHRARHDYLTASVDGRVQKYVNTGAYLPLIQRADDANGFAKSHQLTMAIFYRDDEDKGGEKRTRAYKWICGMGSSGKNMHDLHAEKST